jgi:hypothetical protein
VQPLGSFPAFYGIRRFITEFTRALQLYLSWARPIQSTTLNSNSKRSILMLSIHLRLCLPSGLFPSGFPTNNIYTIHFSTAYIYVLRAVFISPPATVSNRKRSLFTRSPNKQENKTLWPLVRKRTIPTDDRHLSPKFSANFCG